jgi:hypothetical protein
MNSFLFDNRYLCYFDIPLEIWRMIYEYLSYRDIANLSRTCSYFNVLIKDNESFKSFFETLKGNPIVGHISFHPTDDIREISFYFSDLMTSQRASICLRFNVDVEEVSGMYAHAFYSRIPFILEMLESLKDGQKIKDIMPYESEYVVMGYEVPSLSVISDNHLVILQDTHNLYGLNIQLPTPLFIRMMKLYLHGMEQLKFIQDELVTIMDYMEAKRFHLFLYADGRIRKKSNFTLPISELVDGKFTTINCIRGLVYRLDKVYVRYYKRKVQRIHNDERMIEMHFHDLYTGGTASILFLLHNAYTLPRIKQLTTSLLHLSEGKHIDFKSTQSIGLPILFDQVAELDPNIYLTNRSSKEIIELATFNNLHGLTCYIDTMLFHTLISMACEQTKSPEVFLKSTLYMNGDIVEEEFDDLGNPFKYKWINRLYKTKIRISDYVYKKSGVKI